MKDKYKLWICALLLLIVLILMISMLFKITPRKFTRQKSEQNQYSDSSPEQMVDDNALPDEIKPVDEDEEIIADEVINTNS